MTFDSSIRRLKFASGVVIITGAIFVLSVLPAFDMVTRLFFDLAFFPFDGAQAAPSPEARMMAAVAGGVLTGWGVMCWLLTTRVYARDPVLGREVIAISIVIWFVFDSFGSIMAGAWFNAVMNTGFVALFAWPLLAGGPKPAAA